MWGTLSYSMCKAPFPRGHSGCFFKLTARLYLIQRLRIGEGVYYSPPYAFLVWIGTSLLPMNLRTSVHYVPKNINQFIFVMDDCVLCDV